MTTFS